MTNNYCCCLWFIFKWHFVLELSTSGCVPLKTTFRDNWASYLPPECYYCYLSRRSIQQKGFFAAPSTVKTRCFTYISSVNVHFFASAHPTDGARDINSWVIYLSVHMCLYAQVEVFSDWLSVSL